MKRVLFLMDNLEGGGAEKALIEFLRSIDYSKYEVTLCLSFYRGVYLMDIPEKIKVIKLFKSESSFIFRKIFRYYRKHHSAEEPVPSCFDHIQSTFRLYFESFFLIFRYYYKYQRNPP